MNAHPNREKLLLSLGFILTFVFACVAPVVITVDAFDGDSDQNRRLECVTTKRQRQAWWTAIGMIVAWISMHLFYRNYDPSHSELRCLLSAYGVLVSVFIVVLLRDGFFRALAHRAGYGDPVGKPRNAE